jgi:hypothetical protein
MSQIDEEAPLVKNRRFGTRRQPRTPTEVTCKTARGSANLAKALLDVSRSGARLLIRSKLAKGAVVKIGLPWPDQAPHDILGATVAWVVAVIDGGFCVGVQFHRLLSEEDLRLVVGGHEPVPPPPRAPLRTRSASPSAPPAG